MNPKALSLGELYGEFDLNTNEWTDGVLSSVMRQTCAGISKNSRSFPLILQVSNNVCFFLIRMSLRITIIGYLEHITHIHSTYVLQNC